MIIEQFPVSPSQGTLSTIIKSYLYQEYADDSDLQAFIDSYNGITQSYLDWFNNTSLAVYTLNTISGSLLDWIGQGIYNISRPVISTSPSPFSLATGQWNSISLNTTPWDGFNINLNGGSAVSASDDIYKRVMTWILYRGDGRQMTMQWLKRRVARFIYGANGSDIDVGLVSNINITMSGKNITIQLPLLASSESLQALMYQNILPLPFQLNFNIVV